MTECLGKGEKGIKDDPGALSLGIWEHSLEWRSGNWIGLARMERRIQDCFVEFEVTVSYLDGGKVKEAPGNQMRRPSKC